MLLRSSPAGSQTVADQPRPIEARSHSVDQIGTSRHDPHFMLVPSLACPANCSYCFGPQQGPTMSRPTMEATLDFMMKIADETGQRKVKITFHGGEPLQAGHELWRVALGELERRFGRGLYQVALQSNLWLLDDEFCQLFAEHRVEIGTSLDGPEEITDRQRGQGYFARTMQGLEKANCYGMNTGCIATFTHFSAPRWREIFDFFLAERLDFSIHAAVPPLDSQTRQFTISPEQYGRLLCELLDHYVEHRRVISVSSLDQMCQGFGCGVNKVCTFRDCLGMFLAIDPYGDIYPCQRFCGKPAYRLGKLAGCPTLTDLLGSPIANRLAERQEQTASACSGCSHFNYCKGGCPYNAWAGLGPDYVLDPYCPAYKQVFDTIAQRTMKEMATEDNIEAVAARRYNGKGHPLLRSGPLIDLVRDGPHPSKIARTAKRIIAAVELARCPDIPSVAMRLVGMGICRTRQSAEASVLPLYRSLHTKPGLLNNLYLHVTFRCQLCCTHCYACADATGQSQGQMGVDAVLTLVRQAKGAGFRQVIITGGEPLLHQERDELIKGLQRVRWETLPPNLVLRTNFALPLDEDDLRQIAAAFDQVVVSVDGSPQTHDERRGVGSYNATLKNLEAYTQLFSTAYRRDACPPKSEIQNPRFGMRNLECSPGELSLACVMSAVDVEGVPGDSIRQLAARLGVRRTRFRPLLPLGRAADWSETPVPEAHGAHVDPMELIEEGFHPVASCGLGQNLYVDPSGESFPCYACHEPDSYLGNVTKQGLTPILTSTAFSNLSCQTVDTNSRCRQCDLRYLCGGACRAWDGKLIQEDVAWPPDKCDGLRRRAEALVTQAARCLGVDIHSGGVKCSGG